MENPEERLTVVSKLVEDKPAGLRVHLVQQRPRLLGRQELEAPLEDTASVRVRRELEHPASKGLDKVEGRFGEGDDALDDVVGVARLDAVHDVVLELSDEDVALLCADDFESLEEGKRVTSRVSLQFEQVNKKDGV